MTEHELHKKNERFERIYEEVDEMSYAEVVMALEDLVDFKSSFDDLNEKQARERLIDIKLWEEE